MADISLQSFTVNDENGNHYTINISGKLDSSLKGVAGGVAGLNNSGKVPDSQLPSYASQSYVNSQVKNAMDESVREAADLLAPYYSSSKVYSEGDLCTYIAIDPDIEWPSTMHRPTWLYRHTGWGSSTPAAESFTLNHWENVRIQEVIESLPDIPVVMTGATAQANGTSGLVPAPIAGDQGKFLRGDGTWQTVSSSGGGDVSSILLNGVEHLPSSGTVDLGSVLLPGSVTFNQNGTTSTESIMIGLYVNWQNTMYRTTDDIRPGEEFTQQKLLNVSSVGALNDLALRLRSGAYSMTTPTITDGDTSTHLPTSAAVAAFVEGKGYTTNLGTITGITMNGTSKGTSGVVDLGTVLTEHQTITSSMVTDALGYTPYSSANPNGYTSNTGTVTGVKVNGSTKNPSSGVVNLGDLVTPSDVAATEISSPVTWGENVDSSDSTVTMYQIGNIRILHLALKYTGSGTGQKTLATIKSGHRPAVQTYFPMLYHNATPQLANVSNTGLIRLYGNTATSGTKYYGTLIYSV